MLAEEKMHSRAVVKKSEKRREKANADMDDDEAIHLSNKIFIKSMMFASDDVVRLFFSFSDENVCTTIRVE